ERGPLCGGTCSTQGRSCGGRQPWPWGSVRSLEQAPMKTTNPALCATPLAKCTDARGVWESQPLLAYAYGDYRAFEENYNVAKDGADARALGLLRDRFDCEVSALHAARARLALATRPLSNANGAPFSV